jgi:flavin-dependent dehydrogenase
MPETPTATRSSSPTAAIGSVAIIGGGPAGSFLAAQLARAGVRVSLFQRSQRPPLVPGESLVPAVIPFLRKLGIEEEVASYSTWKPGATFTLGPGDEMSFRFADVPNAVTNYAYNVPRDRFDASVIAAAARAGARVVDHPAQVEREAPASPRVRLADATLAAAGLDAQPDLVVDATGRTRLVSDLLGLPYRTGSRRDTALFAHCENVPLSHPGHVHSDRMEYGWCWRIPLPGRVSVGIVVPADVLRRSGDGIETQYDAWLRSDALIGPWAAHAKRLTKVFRYNNYQLTTLRGFGPNWALCGDAFGFIDPIFSSGLLVGLDGAERLARTLLAPSERAWKRYERDVIRHLDAWQRVVELWYSGRLFTLFRVGQVVQTTPVGRILGWHLQRHFPRVFTGEATRHAYSRSLLHFMAHYGLAGNDPAELAVH